MQVTAVLEMTKIYVNFWRNIFSYEIQMIRGSHLPQTWVNYPTLENPRCHQSWCQNRPHAKGNVHAHYTSPPLLMGHRNGCTCGRQHCMPHSPSPTVPCPDHQGPLSSSYMVSAMRWDLSFSNRGGAVMKTIRCHITPGVGGTPFDLGWGCAAECLVPECLTPD